MDRNSKILDVVLFFAGFTAMVVIFMYAVRMPTSKPMNFVLLSYGVFSAFSLLLAAKFSRFYWLCTAVRLGWLLASGVGIIAFATTIVSFVAKWQLPLVSSQWYGIVMGLGVIGALMSKPIAEYRGECVARYKHDYNASGERKVHQQEATQS